MKIAFGSDHAGFQLKEKLKAFVEEKGYEIIDCGTYNESSCDYPEFSFKAANLVADGTARFGVFVCGSGVGISIVANKVSGVRCALVFNNEMAALARQHNDANGIAFGARMISEEEAKLSLLTFLNTEFEGGRHQKRVDLIHELTGR